MLITDKLVFVVAKPHEKDVSNCFIFWCDSGQNLLLPPPDMNRFKVSENLGATAVAPVALADTSLPYINEFVVLQSCNDSLWR